MAWGGRPQGAPLPIAFSRRCGLRRAPTRGAPTNCLLSALCPERGAHKGRPYRLSFLGVMAGGGSPQGAPLPIVFSRRYGRGRAPTRGAPTDCLFSALWPGEGAHKGRPYRFAMPWGGRPQGAPLPIAFSRRCAMGRAPTRGAPTYCLLSAFGPGEGTHKGCPYLLSSPGVMPWGGSPQGAPLPIRYALGREPTRGAPTRFRQPHVGLSQFDAIALHFGMHPAAMGRARAQFGSRRSCSQGNRRRPKDDTYLAVFVPVRKAETKKGHEGPLNLLPIVSISAALRVPPCPS